MLELPPGSRLHARCGCSHLRGRRRRGHGAHRGRRLRQPRLRRPHHQRAARHLAVRPHDLGLVPLVVGQQIKAGEFIGQVGSTGASTGAHLHFEIHLDGVPVDPYAWLTANAS
ncbi:M23 family metallopeptidase [Microcella daejeonensis]|uniref:M23 family metallopeptidase n=1 Tax=Microcella daejeonensis TaxID=2994971 RepID=UPI0039843AF6